MVIADLRRRVASHELLAALRLVAYWPIATNLAPLDEVRLVGWSGLDLLTLSSSDFDP